MRATCRTVLILPLLLFAMKPAGGEESAAADAPAASASKTEVDAEFKIPPGFKARKRGKFTVYCQKQQVIGTRFEAEKCYDETGIREMLRAQRDDQEKVDQMRRICGSVETCGGG